MKGWSPESQDVLSPGKAISSLQPDASLTWLCALLQPPPPWSRSKVRLVVPPGSPWIQPRQHAHSLPGPASRDLCSSQAHLQHDKRESDVVSAYRSTHLGVLWILRNRCLYLRSLPEWRGPNVTANGGRPMVSVESRASLIACGPGIGPPGTPCILCIRSREPCVIMAPSRD